MARTETRAADYRAAAAALQEWIRANPWTPELADEYAARRAALAQIRNAAGIVHDVARAVQADERHAR